MCQRKPHLRFAHCRSDCASLLLRTREWPRRDRSAQWPIGKCAFSGVRPSSGAEAGERRSWAKNSSAFDDAELAATEDGRTPPNRCVGNRQSAILVALLLFVCGLAL